MPSWGSRKRVRKGWTRHRLWSGACGLSHAPTNAGGATILGAAPARCAYWHLRGRARPYHPLTHRTIGISELVRDKARPVDFPAKGLGNTASHRAIGERRHPGHDAFLTELSDRSNRAELGKGIRIRRRWFCPSDGEGPVRLTDPGYGAISSPCEHVHRRPRMRAHSGRRARVIGHLPKDSRCGVRAEERHQVAAVARPAIATSRDIEVTALSNRVDPRAGTGDRTEVAAPDLRREEASQTGVGARGEGAAISRRTDQAHGFVAAAVGQE